MSASPALKPASVKNNILTVPSRGESAERLLIWLSQNQGLTKEGITLEQDGDFLKLQLYSGTQKDLQKAASFINKEEETIPVKLK